ncbi:DUF4376 domain-containing protein [Kiloniella laminariae]|uniref:DUF4376 domain-containing protein n=1 Tax=Kiloniella laminariae TaxID=454162 RepID=A0ABT4LP12_9PROT|nr:DUF4376 domain-containing protein [Kiloniella laminariae]MCZ4281697.1 DUF4376 domain-containing protein [Kiloniella laminariae]
MKTYIKVIDGAQAGDPFILPATLPHPDFPDRSIGVKHLDDDHLFDLFNLVPVIDVPEPDQEWDNVVDSGIELVVENNGSELSDITATQVYNTAPISLAEAQAKVMAKVKSRRDAIADDGDFEWSLEGVTYRLQGTSSSVAQMERSRDLLNEMIARGIAAEEAKQPWRTWDNGWTPPLTPDQINDMAYTKGLQGISCWQRYAALEQEIAAAADLAAVMAIDITTGWPELPANPGAGE